MARAARTEYVDTSDLLTSSQAAAVLGISARTLDRLKSSGAIGYCSVREGARLRVFYAKDQLDTYRESTRLQVIEATK